MSITQQHTEELLSRSYATAIAAIAGMNLSHREHDYGIDGTFHAVTLTQNNKGEMRRQETGNGIDFQAKSSIHFELDPLYVKYNLDADAFNLLTEQNGRDGVNPCLLLFLCLPRDEPDWIGQDEDQLVLRKACYWFCPRGLRTENLSKVRLHIPRSQLFTPTALKDIMDRVKRRERI